MKKIFNIKRYTQKKIFLILAQLLPKLPPRTANKVLIGLSHITETLNSSDEDKKSIRNIRRMIKERHPTFQLIMNGMARLSSRCRRGFANNLIANTFLSTNEARNIFEQECGFKPPFFMVISPSMKCNLNCRGCYAGEYSKKDDLDFDTVDRVISEAKEMGTGFITITGGEPFIWKNLLDLFSKHNDMYFQIYTNGTLIDKDMAKRLRELGNVACAISVEGFRKETDERRGKGTFKKIMQAMDNLKREGVLFGFSATPTRLNAEVLMSDKFVDFYIKKGCLFGWYFQYIPIGKKPDISLMSTPEERNSLRQRLREIRNTKPIFIGDFWNDGPYIHGCIAGGRIYLHINCKGDVEPCAFVHFAVDNIKNKSLKEVLNSGFFKAIREKQQSPYAPKRYNDNLLTPCMIIDNPWVLREVVKQYKAYPTHPGAETIVQNPDITRHLDRYSKRMHELTDKVWEEEYKSKFSSKEN